MFFSLPATKHITTVACHDIAVITAFTNRDDRVTATEHRCSQLLHLTGRGATIATEVVAVITGFSGVEGAVGTSTLW